VVWDAGAAFSDSPSTVGKTVPELFAQSPDRERVLEGCRRALAGESSKKCNMSTQDCLDHMAAQLKTTGFVGVELDTDRADGLAVTKVFPGSPAEAAGIRVGDVLESLNGVAINHDNEDALAKARKDWKPGQQVTYTLKRNGAGQTINLTLAPWPADMLAKYIGQHMLEHAHTDGASAAAR